MAGTEGKWYAIENDFCTQSKRKSAPCFRSSDEHIPDCVELRHKILFKVADNKEYKPEVERGEGNGRNSVVEEFLANLESLNTSRRRSSSKLLHGFVFDQEIAPSLSTKTPGFEVYLPQCFSPTNLEKLAVSLDHDEFQFTALDQVTNDTSFDETQSFSQASRIGVSNGNDAQRKIAVSGGLGSAEMTTEEHATSGHQLQETTEKLSSFSLQENDKTSNLFSTQRNLTERKRRNTLNEKFAKLREVIPDIGSNEKISKINILRKAVDCIRKLEQEEETYRSLKAKEKARNKQLLQKLVEFNRH